MAAGKEKTLSRRQFLRAAGASALAVGLAGCAPAPTLAPTPAPTITLSPAPTFTPTPPPVYQFANAAAMIASQVGFETAKLLIAANPGEGCDSGCQAIASDKVPGRFMIQNETGAVFIPRFTPKLNLDGGVWIPPIASADSQKAPLRAGFVTAIAPDSQLGKHFPHPSSCRIRGCIGNPGRHRHAGYHNRPGSLQTDCHESPCPSS